MKKIVYLAPLALLGMGVKVSANQAPTHISNALRVYEQEYSQMQTANQSMRQAKTDQVGQNGSTFSNYQNQPIGKAEETTHISRLDTGFINEDSSVGSGQASQVMKINKSAIPTKQELNESKESVAGQYVQVRQNRVAQFNKGSKIYGLNNSNQLSKSNGDGYVITNAGTYNGRAVDIGVTINNVKDNQGSYTTKWSNGDKADVTGKTDASFKYDNSALLGTQQDAITVPNKTRRKEVRVTIPEQVSGVWVYHETAGYNNEDYGGAWNPDTYVDPALLMKVMRVHNFTQIEALHYIFDHVISLGGFSGTSYDAREWLQSSLWNKTGGLNFDEALAEFKSNNNLDSYLGGQFANTDKGKYNRINGDTNDDSRAALFPDFRTATYSVHHQTDTNRYDNKITLTHYLIRRPTHRYPFGITLPIGINAAWITDKGRYGFDSYSPQMAANGDMDTVTQMADSVHQYSEPTTVDLYKSKNIVYTLQLDNKTDASLNYDYTIGVYDAQTGELIKDLTAEYKGKTGKTATDQDTAMNSAVKAKIQAINNNTANSAYTGTVANDDVTFSKNTVHVNYVDTRGESINVPGYDIDVDNLTSGNYQVPQNYVLVNTNGFKVTKNTHEVNGITVTDSYNFIDQGHNKVTNNGKTLSVVLAHGTTHVDASHSGLSNDATNNAFVINNGAKRQINSQSRHFSASGILDLVTNKITMQGDWQLSGKSNFDQTNINNDLVGYGNAIHSNLTFLAL